MGNKVQTFCHLLDNVLSWGIFFKGMNDWMCSTTGFGNSNSRSILCSIIYKLELINLPPNQQRRPGTIICREQIIVKTNQKNPRKWRKKKKKKTSQQTGQHAVKLGEKYTSYYSELSKIMGIEDKPFFFRVWKREEETENLFASKFWVDKPSAN